MRIDFILGYEPNLQAWPAIASRAETNQIGANPLISSVFQNG
jgi:hypothetical protein